MDKHLHIVCLNVPYPADYGGVFDLFYKINTLHGLGIKIHLHCFEYGRGVQEELEKYCVEVNYYKRKKGIGSFSFSLPYIVNSRKDELLSKRLTADYYPVLFEGIHCTYPLHSGIIKNKKTFVRLHNVEFNYYKHLGDAEKHPFKKFYYFIESSLLKRYEKSLVNKSYFLTVSENDRDVYKSLGCKNVSYLPVFLPFNSIGSKIGKCSFCLYHGDLSVGENIKAVRWLIDLFKQNKVPFVIAGKDASPELQKFAEQHENICMILNPKEDEMQDLITKAQIHVLPSFNNTGVKIKLLNALFNGRHVIVNEHTVDDTELAKLVHVCKTDKAFQEKIAELLPLIFTKEEIINREEILCSIYNNHKNAEKLVSIIFG